MGLDRVGGVRSAFLPPVARPYLASSHSFVNSLRRDCTQVSVQVSNKRAWDERCVTHAELVVR
jgi:hypothetical protein